MIKEKQILFSGYLLVKKEMKKYGSLLAAF